MKKIIGSIAVILMSGTASFAGNVDVSSESVSQSSSGIYNGGDTIRSSSVGAPSMNSTAPCVIGTSTGIGVLGTGFSRGSGKIDRDCVTREEARILTQITNMPPEARMVAIIHFCKNTPSMRDTMEAMGWCASTTSKVSPQQTTNTVATRVYLSCGPEGVGINPSWTESKKKQAHKECAFDLKNR